MVQAQPPPPWEGRAIATHKLRLVEFSAYMEQPRDQDMVPFQGNLDIKKEAWKKNYLFVLNNFFLFFFSKLFFNLKNFFHYKFSCFFVYF